MVSEIIFILRYRCILEYLLFGVLEYVQNGKLLADKTKVMQYDMVSHDPHVTIVTC